MEKCLHVSKIRPAWDHSILNPEKWMCYICRTTESVWACLSCSNVACGRFNEKHALKHYQESKHPISIEVNEKYVYCYACDDYVLNDNAAGDIKLLRSALSAIATQKFTDIESRGRRLLRSYSHTGIVQRDTADEADKLATADWHLRQRLLGWVFGAWRTYIQMRKTTPRSSRQSSKRPVVSTSSQIFKKRTITPGVTGLRNLGNTCYMNSVLQILSHIEAFRDFFLKMNFGFASSPDGSPRVKHECPSWQKHSPRSQREVTPPSPDESSQHVRCSTRLKRERDQTLLSTTESAHSTMHKVVSPASRVSPRASCQGYIRQTTVECFQHLMTDKDSRNQKKKHAGGLNGGSTKSTPVKQQLICDVESQGNKGENVSLCAELHGLFRVLWSGKWAQVSPHAFLRAVWQAIPMFKGYAQHDAQEFLCELLDKVQRELDHMPKLPVQPSSDLLTYMFQGQLVSLVTCENCGNESRTFEPYLDLSLEFPNRYQITKHNSRVAEDICHITEMLAKFTEEEKLEGDIYACEKCNKNRRKSSGTVYTGAKKQLLINKLPPILRLHLKRFRWSGRIHREKISTHVATDEVLNLSPFCSTNVGPGHHYHLFGLIIHHGRGFGSGHYTSYTWNNEAGSWVNCNDSRMILSSVEDVLTAQAYILFYRNVMPLSMTKPVSLLSETSAETTIYSLKSCDTVWFSDTDEDKTLPTVISSSSSPCMPKLHHEPASNTTKLSPPTLQSCDTMPLLVKNPSTPSPPKIPGSKRKLYSLKADGTQILQSDDSSLDSETSMLSDSSVHIVDGEISFNFKNTPEASENFKRELKRHSLGNEYKLSVSGPSETKKQRKLSFQPGEFYSSPKRPESPDNNRSQPRETVFEDASSGDSDTRSNQRRRSARLDVNNTVKMAKLEKYIAKNNADELEAASLLHVKRRKTTFW